MRSKLLSFLNWITCILHNKCISICWAVSTNLDYLSLLLFLFWHVDSFAKNKRRRCQQHLNLQTSRIWANRPYTRGSRLLFEVIKSIIILIILVQHEQKFPFHGWKVLNSCALSGPHSYLHFGCRIKRIKLHDWMLKLACWFNIQTDCAAPAHQPIQPPVCFTASRHPAQEIVRMHASP